MIDKLIPTNSVWKFFCSAAVALCILLLPATSLRASATAANRDLASNEQVLIALDSQADWEAATEEGINISAKSTHPIGGGYDVLGNGTILLEKTDVERPFWKVDTFKTNGQWRSKWISLPSDRVLSTVSADLLIYGQEQDMRSGWTKLDDNPLVVAHDWKLASPRSLKLPSAHSGSPNDQTLLRGTGPWEGKWLLMFNIGSWARLGWGMATADSLEPLKQNRNPFELANPYPLFEGTDGENAPNDWIEYEGVWYGPDETPENIPHMWSSADLTNWTDEGVIEGVTGHDPGICYDGDQFYLFNEVDDGITYATAPHPLGPWTDRGMAFRLGSHSGDAALSFFNNRWHMTYDDNPHLHYMIGYASTMPSQFPTGWKLQRKIFGPHTPEQGQLWDDDTEDGNEFGTGDADWALEGTTLYMTYERPIGLAYKELDLYEASEQTVDISIEVDNDGDGEPDIETGWHPLVAGQAAWNRMSGLPVLSGQQVRVTLRYATRNATESPAITHLELATESASARA